MLSRQQEYEATIELQEKELKELRFTYEANLQSTEKALRESLAKKEMDWKKSFQVQRVREIARTALPADAIVIVISKGDDELLNLDGRYGWHFPQTAGGVYAGYHPANSAEAISHLECLRARGAGFLLIPNAAFWWLDHYVEFKQHLDSNYQVIAFQEDACLIYALRADAGHHSRVQVSDSRPKVESTNGNLRPNGTKVSAPTQAVETRARRTITIDEGKPSLGVILDEFTTACIQPECNLITFRPDNWKKVLEDHDLDVLLVESAWRGNDGGWQYKIASYEKSMGEELAELVKYCKSRSIPTVFWNKEDPSNFNRFIDKAALFDYVFTSDSDCIPEYRKRLRHDRIFPLPFAAQPKIHNPILDRNREFHVCFAGAYYGIDHDERRLDMEHVLKPALDYGLHIYDRQHGLVGPLAEQFCFPEIYRPAIKGRLEYDDMLKAYKQYKVFLNVNSVKTSPTMFSRRVFELLACGTPVISAYAKGIEKMLGRDVVLITKSEKETKQHLERLLTDEKEWARVSAKGIRAVLEGHTYANRLTQILGQLGLESPDRQPLTITVVAKVHRQADVGRLIETLKRQTLQPFELLIRLDKGLKKKDVEPVLNALPNILVQILSGRANGIKACAKAIKGEYLWVMNSEDYYGPNFLKDCALATTYSDADVIGKHTHFQMSDGQAALTCPGSEFKNVRTFPAGSFISRTRTITRSELEALLSNRAPKFRGKQLLSIDRFNFIKDAYASERIGPRLMKKLSTEISI